MKKKNLVFDLHDNIIDIVEGIDLTTDSVEHSKKTLYNISITRSGNTTIAETHQFRKELINKIIEVRQDEKVPTADLGISGYEIMHALKRLQLEIDAENN